MHTHYIYIIYKYRHACTLYINIDMHKHYIYIIYKCRHAYTLHIHYIYVSAGMKIVCIHMCIHFKKKRKNRKTHPVEIFVISPAPAAKCAKKSRDFMACIFPPFFK